MANFNFLVLLGLALAAIANGNPEKPQSPPSGKRLIKK
jgi:hypothetical protein